MAIVIVGVCSPKASLISCSSHGTRVRNVRKEKEQLYCPKKALPVLLFWAIFMSLVFPVSGVSSTIKTVSISAPSSALVGQPITVRATVSTTDT